MGKEIMHLKDLATYCQMIRHKCQKCENIEFCSSYSRFMAAIAPMYWADNPNMDIDVVFTKDGYERADK